jgi:uncharacterized protein (TIGR02594 family)
MIHPTWLAIAEEELGITEVPGKDHHPRILEYHATTTLKERAAGRDETPWCSSFVNWCLEQAGYVGTDSALARSWLSWGIEEVDAKLGAICVIKKRVEGADAATGSRRGYHVGFVADGLRQEGMLRLIGGNQRDQVKYSRYPRSKYKIWGYRWPIERI